MFKKIMQQVKQLIDEGTDQDSGSDPSSVKMFRESLVAALRNPPANGICVDDYVEACGISTEEASQVCEDLFLLFSRKVTSDGVITEAERSKMRGLAETLGVGSAKAEELVGIAALEFYRTAVDKALVDGAIDAEAANRLTALRRSLDITVNPGLAERSAFRDELIRDFKRLDPVNFDLTTYAADARFSMAVASEIAEDLYAKFARKVVADGIVSQQERANLEVLSRAFRISPNLAEWIEAQAKEQVYRKLVLEVLADGIISPSEAVRLESLRGSLGIKAKDAASTTSVIAADAYRAMINNIVRRGAIDESSLMELERFKRVLSLSKFTAREIIPEEALEIYREAASEVLQDGIVEPGEEEMLAWLRKETGVYDEEIEDLIKKIAEIKRLAEYRTGRIPSVRSQRLLEGGEICHWDGGCIFVYSTKRGTEKVEGELIVTNKRITFVSPTRSFSYAPWKIIDLDLEGHKLTIKTDMQKANGMYFVDPSAELEAILVGLARKGKYTAADGFSSEKSRHIPGEVKRAVWDRDGGRCVQCDDDRYLEFDHIIPHSKGGANTVGNVQLLCRKCNNDKGDRI